jgi:hypothetical protein
MTWIIRPYVVAAPTVKNTRLGFTSWSTHGSSRGSGTFVKQVQDSYNGLGQLITEYQAHAGPVNVNIDQAWAIQVKKGHPWILDLRQK